MYGTGDLLLHLFTVLGNKLNYSRGRTEGRSGSVSVHVRVVE